jgi:hypothetical protein
MALEAEGLRCHVPSVADTGGRPVRWRDWPDRIVAALPGVRPMAIIGHSAAGLLLPAIARLMGAPSVVFVDAQVPPRSRRVRPIAGEFERFIQALPVSDGLLPRWSEWWGEGVIERLIHDAETRARFESELPRLPPGWFDDSVEVPDWGGLRAGYVQTSAPYGEEAGRARANGWPVVALDGTHLHPYLAPGETATAIGAVLNQFALQVALQV